MLDVCREMARESLMALRERIRRIERPTATAYGATPFGLAAIDRVLPGGGLARGALHEILGAGGDEEDGGLAAAFAAGILARLAMAADGIVLWCLLRPDLYGPGLAALGLDPARLVLVRARRDAEILWAMEEGLRAPGIAAVVGEIGALDPVASRRLQLAAEHSGVTALVLRRWRSGAAAQRERNRPNAAATRWRIAALPSQPPPIASSARRGQPLLTLSPARGEPPPISSPARGGGSGWGLGIGQPRWRVELLRCRGGEPACWAVEVIDATGSLSLVARLADRPDARLAAAAIRSTEFRHAG